MRIVRISLVILSIFLLFLALLTGCNGAKPQEEITPYPNPVSYPNPVLGCPKETCFPGTPVRFSGWLSIIQNGHTIYLITAEDGRSVELLMDESLLASVGGGQALQQKHVTVMGEWTADQPSKIKVFTIQIDQ